MGDIALNDLYKLQFVEENKKKINESINEKD